MIRMVINSINECRLLATLEICDISNYTISSHGHSVIASFYYNNKLQEPDVCAKNLATVINEVYESINDWYAELEISYITYLANDNISKFKRIELPKKYDL